MDQSAQTLPADTSHSSAPLEMDEASRARSDTYAILASLFNATPSGDLIDYLCHIEAPDNLEEGAEQKMGAAGEAWLGLRQAAQAIRNNADKAQQLDDEYHDLFIGIGRGQVIPHGSWHLTGFLMDKPLSDLRKDLKALGFVSSETQKDPEDHISALFETMSILITAQDVEGYQQRRFFIQHIHPWVGKFFEQVRQAKSANFYQHVAQLGEQFMLLENEYLNIQEH